MRLRTFTAPDMPAAMKLVREALGDEAIILATEPHGKKGVSVTAAIEAQDDVNPSPHRGEVRRGAPLAPPEPSNPGFDAIRFELQNILRFHNLPELFIAKLMQQATDRELNAAIATHRKTGEQDVRHLVKLALEKALSGFYSFNPLPLQGGGSGRGLVTNSEPSRSPLPGPPPYRGREQDHTLLTGPPGIGKTLTVAKIAARLTLAKQKLAVITTDNKRAGGVEQLQAFTTILGLELHIAPNVNALAAHLANLPPGMRALIDTAGCNPYDANDMQELKAYASLPGIEPILVLPAGGDSLEAIDIVEAFMEMLVTRLLVTRTDTARRFGGVLAAAAAHGLTFANASGSSSIVDPLQPMDAALLAQLLLRYRFDPQ